MPEPILVTGAAGGPQGSTGLRITEILLEQRVSVRAFVHRLDARSEALEELGAEVVQGDLLDRESVSSALKGVRRSFFTYPVKDGLLEATTVFAAAAREAGTELVLNNSQLQSDRNPPSFRNMQHGLSERIFDWANVGAVHLRAAPYYENVRVLTRKTVSERNTVYLPWGDGSAVIPLVGAEDVSRVAAKLLASPKRPSVSGYDLIAATPTVRQIVETMSLALGRPIHYAAITDEQWVEAMKDHINPHGLDHLTNLWRYFRTKDKWASEARSVTDAIQEVTGSHALSLKDFFTANMAMFSGTETHSF